MQSHHVYSPLPATAYHITTLETCEASAIGEMQQPDALAVWNLFWLSVPTVDLLPVHGRRYDWGKHYMPTPGALGAVTADAIADTVMFYKLQMHPARFLDWFRRADHSQYKSYQELNGQSWVNTVTERAVAAIVHVALVEQPMPRPDNILLFRKRLA